MKQGDNQSKVNNSNKIKGKELEQEVIKTFKDSKWAEVFTGLYYRDLQTLVPREIDLITTAVFGLGGKLVHRVTFVIEVKYFNQNLLIWEDIGKKKDRINYLEQLGLTKTEVGDDSLLSFNKVVKTWSQGDSTQEKEQIYSAISTLLSILSTSIVERMSFDTNDYNEEINHVILPVIIYKSSDDVTLRDVGTGSEKKVNNKNFVLQVYNSYPTKQENFINRLEYIFVINYNNLNSFIENAIKEFTPSHLGGLSNGFAGKLIDTYNDQHREIGEYDSGNDMYFM